MLQAQTQEAEKQIKEEFERLHQILKNEEESRITALKAEEMDKKKILEEKIESISHDISNLGELIQSVKREMGAEDLTFLQVRILYLILIRFYMNFFLYLICHFFTFSAT